MSRAADRDAAWLAKQAAFVAARDELRAQVCRCGHRRYDHFEEIAFCRDCRCGSFTHQETP